MDTRIVFDQDLIQRYDIAGPRYTSYPTAVQFGEHFQTPEYRRQAIVSNLRGKPLSLYVHIPFCGTVCYYCACNKIITANRRRAGPYLQRVQHEIVLQSQFFNRDRPVTQLHWGGGTPTFINNAQMRELMQVTRDHFNLFDDDSGEYSIEIDPREVDPDIIWALRELGFNRLSLGVQDFDPEVQRAVNRIQPYSITESALTAARQAGFKSLSFDLIYGLPKQTVASFDRTLDAVIDLSPDRLSVFNYAHMPALFKVQRQIKSAELPSAAEKLSIFKHVIQRLTNNGYVYIGMDHFAKPDDELARAQQHGTLYRNFQGYSTHANCDVIGLGLSAIGKVGDSYGQNAKTLDQYYAELDQDRLPIQRGVTLTSEDKLRRAIITQLICHFDLNFTTIEDQFNIRFREKFEPELKQLATMAGDGLLRLWVDRLEVLPRGRLLIRNICMVFDQYLRKPDQQQRFSKAI